MCKDYDSKVVNYEPKLFKRLPLMVEKANSSMRKEISSMLISVNIAKICQNTGTAAGHS